MGESGPRHTRTETAQFCVCVRTNRPGEENEREAGWTPTTWWTPRRSPGFPESARPRGAFGTWRTSSLSSRFPPLRSPLSPRRAPSRPTRLAWCLPEEGQVHDRKGRLAPRQGHRRAAVLRQLLQGVPRQVGQLEAGRRDRLGSHPQVREGKGDQDLRRSANKRNKKASPFVAV